MTPPKFGPQLTLPLNIVGGGRVSSAALLTRDEIVRGLVAQGVPRAKAERVAGAQSPIAAAGEEDLVVFTMPDPAPLRFPLRLELPWSALVSDNKRHGAILTTVGPTRKPIPKLIMGAEYRAAKGKVMAIARDRVAGADPTTDALRLEARVWVPNTRLHDVCNFAKAVHDALTKIVYVDDSQLHDTRWIKAGVDVDRPRAELIITPIPGVTP